MSNPNRYAKPSVELDRRVHERLTGVKDVLHPPQYSLNMQVLSPYLEEHANWSIRRINYGTWLVKHSESHNQEAFGSETLPTAICLALLDLVK